MITEPHSPMQFPPVPARTEHRQKSQLNTCVLFLVYLLRIKNSQALIFYFVYNRQLTFHLPARGQDSVSTRSAREIYQNYCDFLFFPGSTMVSKKPDATAKYSPFKKTPSSEAYLMVWQRNEVTHDSTAHRLVPISPKKAPDVCFAEVGHNLMANPKETCPCETWALVSCNGSVGRGAHHVSGFPLLAVPTAPDTITPRLLRKC